MLLRHWSSVRPLNLKQDRTQEKIQLAQTRNNKLVTMLGISIKDQNYRTKKTAQLKRSGTRPLKMDR